MHVVCMSVTSPRITDCVTRVVAMTPYPREGLLHPPVLFFLLTPTAIHRYNESFCYPVTLYLSLTYFRADPGSNPSEGDSFFVFKKSDKVFLTFFIIFHLRFI